MKRIITLLLLFFAPDAVLAQLGGGGIFIDPEGVMRGTPHVRRHRNKKADISQQIANPSELRKVSLRKLDKTIRSLPEGEAIPQELALLAGLVEIKYLVVDRENQDLLLVGSAEGWETDVNGREIGIRSNRAVLHLEDLAAAMRCVFEGQGYVDCSIDPQSDGLTAIQRYKLPSLKRTREAEPYIEEIKKLYGLQTVRTSGVPRGSRFSLVMIEADYRMKRMAIGEEPVRGITSHLEILADMLEEGASRQNLLARWWFAPAYSKIVHNDQKTIFSLEGQGVKLLNESVFVDREGFRHGMGATTPEWDKFSDSFTRRYDELQRRYPVYSDLRNLFDLMMISGIVKSYDLGDWLKDSIFLDASSYQIATDAQPEFAEPVVNCKIHAKRQGRRRTVYTTFAWGGVAMQPMKVLQAGVVEQDSGMDELALKLDPEVESPSLTESVSADWWGDITIEEKN